MASYLDALLAKYSDELAVLLLPVPLDGYCNFDPRIGSGYTGSCEITRTMLAVWREKPEVFPAYHQALIADPSPDSARRLALGVMSPEHLDAARADDWITRLIRSNIADSQELSQSVDKLPKLSIRDRRVLHGLLSNENEFIRVMEKELGL